jgi:hypothetical protein
MGVERRRNSVSERLPLRGRLLTASLTNGPDPPSVTRNIAVRGPERAGAYARVIGGSGRRGVGGVQGVAVLEAKSPTFNVARLSGKAAGIAIHTTNARRGLELGGTCSSIPYSRPGVQEASG